MITKEELIKAAEVIISYCHTHTDVCGDECVLSHICPNLYACFDIVECMKKIISSAEHSDD